MLLLILFTILLCTQKAAGYYYPVTAEAQEALEFVVDSSKKLCSLSYWLEWFSPRKPQIIEPTYMSRLLIWLGLKDPPTFTEPPEDRYYFCIAIVFIVCAMAYTLYMMVTRHYRGEDARSLSALLPFLRDVEFDDSDEEYAESVISMKSFTGGPCPCNSCMDETGDMKT